MVSLDAPDRRRPKDAYAQQESRLGAFVDAEIKKTIDSVSSEALEVISSLHGCLSRLDREGPIASKTTSRRGPRVALLRMFRPGISAPSSTMQDRKDLLDTLGNATTYLSGVKENQGFNGIEESDIADALKGLEEIINCAREVHLALQAQKDSSLSGQRLNTLLSKWLWEMQDPAAGTDDSDDSPESAGDSELAGPSKICSLEAAYRVTAFYGRSQIRTHDWHDFILWARFEGVSSTINDEIGAVQSVHLFRETGGIHHEFVLVRFGGECIPSSWLRLERAARFKQHWHRLQFDSFGPIFAGVALRESVSFGCSKPELLFQEADELGSVRITPARDTTNAPLHLAELVDQIRTISDTSPKYRLLTHNCRWFARRILLTFAQRQARLAPGTFGVLWNDMPSSYSELRRLVTKDPFGGRPVGGKNGQWIQALSLCRAADIYRSSGRSAEALALCVETLPAVRSMARSGPTDERKVLLSQCLTTQFIVLQHLNRYDEAIKVAEEVANIIHTVKSQTEVDPLGINALIALENSCNLFASQGQFELAEEGMHTVVNMWRAFYESTRRAPTTAIYYMQARGNMALRFQGTGKLQEALREAEEAVRCVAELYQTRRDLYCFDLAWLLQTFAHILQSAGRLGEAYLVSALGIHFYREEFASRPEPCESCFAMALYTHAKLAERLGPGYQSVRDASYSDAIKHTRQLFNREPDAYRVNLAVFISGRFRCQMEAHVAFLSQPSMSPFHFDADFAQSMVDLLQESIDLYRTLAKQDPILYTYYLLRDLEGAAQLLTLHGRATDATLYSKEYSEVAGIAQMAGIDATTLRQIRLYHTRSSML